MSARSSRFDVLAVPLAFAALKLVLQAIALPHWGYFRDELYYLDMARHLDWGYVDAAPLVAVYAKVALLLGGSLAALRVLPALAGTALVALAVLLAREVGGGRFAQLLAGLSVLLAPGILLVDSLLSMNAFEPLFWTGAALVLARLLRTGDSRLWVWFGVLVGLGLENKHSTLFFGFAVAVALLLAPERRELLRPWVWVGLAIALALFLPNVVWQARHGFPTLEDLENVRREGKNVVLGPLAFVKQQVVAMHPALLPVWLAGVAWFVKERRWRLLGFTFVTFFVVMELAHAKDYYLFPIYPMAFAGGAVAIERWTARRASAWRPALAAAVVVLGLVTLPLCTWLLAPADYLAYTERLGFRQQKAEVHHEGLLPQPMGDQFGWEEMAREVAAIYHALPPAERAKTGILTGNYGEAGAINFYGPALGLPRAFSRHQNHWYWGPPEESYTNLIVLQWDRDTVLENCSAFDEHPRHVRWGMGEENTPIYLCRGTLFDLRKVWPNYHHWN